MLLRIECIESSSQLFFYNKEITLCLLSKLKRNFTANIIDYRTLYNLIDEKNLLNLEASVMLLKIVYNNRLLNLY